MSETPRTDAEEQEHYEMSGLRCVSLDFARQLERELTEAKADAENYRAMLGEVMNDRDSWKAKAEALSPSTFTPDEVARLKAHYGFTDEEIARALAVRHKDGRLASIVMATAEGATK